MTITDSLRTIKRLNLPPRPVMFGALALLAPIAYLIGRIGSDNLSGGLSKLLAGGLATTALGVMIGLPIGLFFGVLRRPVQRASAPNTRAMEREILAEIRRELAEDQALFEARQGSTGMYARIDYISAFWTTVKASGRLFVMPDAQLLRAVAMAYYWLEQASHLETLAYEARYARPDEGDHATAARLISEARLLDGQLESALRSALQAVDKALQNT